MTHILTAAVMAASIWFSLQGVIAGTYVIFTLLGLNILLVSFYAAVALGMSMSKVDINVKVSEKQEQNLSVMFLVRLMFFAAAWHVFTLGHVALAGAAFVTITINTLTLVILGIDKFIEKNK